MPINESIWENEITLGNNNFKNVSEKKNMTGE